MHTKMSDKQRQSFEEQWDEVRDCYFRIKLKRAKIVMVRERSGREYRYTKPL